MSAEVVETAMLSESDARRLTNRIGLLLDAAAGTLDKLADAIREARDGRADVALGYASWADYATAEFAPHTAGLAASIRRELVSSLSIETAGSPALSTPQLAPALGVNQSTVVRDRQAMRTAYPAAPQVIPEVSPEPDDISVAEFVTRTANATEEQFSQALADAESEGDVSRRNVAAHIPAGVEPATDIPAFDPRTGEVLSAPAPKVLGLDGKAYSRPEPKPRTNPRRPLPDQARAAGIELRKAVERLERIAADDRFGRNKEEVAAHLRHHLDHAIEVCQDLNASLN